MNNVECVPSAAHNFKKTKSMEQEERKQNNCYSCKFRAEVPGSAHSECTVPSKETGLKIAFEIAKGRIPTITNKDTGEVLLELHKHGVRNGWCMWPLNFDPVWVTCRLPLDELEEEGDETKV